MLSLVHLPIWFAFGSMYNYLICIFHTWTYLYLEHSFVKKVFVKAKKRGLKLCLGGAVSVESLTFLKRLNEEGLLDKFETRYAIYDPAIALKNLPKALAMGQSFELEWLQCKYEYYTALANQDINRIQMIEFRMNESKTTKTKWVIIKRYLTKSREF